MKRSRFTDRQILSAGASGLGHPLGHVSVFHQEGFEFKDVVVGEG